MTPLPVSVIIPAYRASGTICRAVDSALGQTIPPVEVIVIDDGSPDGDDTARILGERYRDRVRVLRKPNGGAASARNHGIDHAGGEVIAFLDADDYWEPDKLAFQQQVFARHPEVGLTAGRWFTQVPGQERHPPDQPADELYDRVLTATGPTAFRVATRLLTSTIAVRRRALGSQRFVSGLEPAEDRDLWCRLVTATPVFTTAAPLITYVLEAGSLSRTQFDRDYGNMLRVINRHAGLLGPRARREWEALTYRNWASSHLGAGKPRAALGPAVKRLRRQPLSAEAWWVLGKCLALSCRPGVGGRTS